MACFSPFVFKDLFDLNITLYFIFGKYQTIKKPPEGGVLII